MKYIVRPRAWLDIEETMTYLRDQVDDDTAIRFWQRAQDTFFALTRQPRRGTPATGFKPKWFAFLARQ